MEKYTVVAPAFVSAEVAANNPAEAGQRWQEWRARHGELALSHGVSVLQVVDGQPPQIIDARGKLVGVVPIVYTGRNPIG